MNWRKAIAVFAGAGVGATLRWIALEEWIGLSADAAILLVNLLGVAVLSFVLHRRPLLASSELESLIAAGFCGALTTWSSLALLTAGHLRESDYGAGLGWLALNLAGAFLVVGASRHLMQRREEASEPNR